MHPDFQETAPKAHVAGSHRLVSPGETLARVRQFMPAMGITRIANVTGLDVIGIPVTMAVRPNARTVSVSQGKGLTLDAARVSGLMESIESYHAETITLPLKLASYMEMRHAHQMVDIVKLPRVGGSTFSEESPIHWIEGYDLLNDTHKWLPYEMVHTNYTVPFITGERTFHMSSNGLASGNHLLEATVHAVHEVVERDATTLWYQHPLNHRMQTRVDANTIPFESCRWLLERFDGVGVGYVIWNQTSDVGLPTFECAIFDREDSALKQRNVFAGMGTHSSVEIALVRAITEAAQSRLTHISGSRDDIAYGVYEDTKVDALRTRLRQIHAEVPPTVDVNDLPYQDYDTFNEDLDYQLRRLEAVGIEEVLVVDLTKPAFDIPVVRVVIPGLESTFHHHSDYVPGERARRVLEQQP